MPTVTSDGASSPYSHLIESHGSSRPNYRDFCDSSPLGRFTIQHRFFVNLCCKTTWRISGHCEEWPKKHSAEHAGLSDDGFRPSLSTSELTLLLPACAIKCQAPHQQGQTSLRSARRRECRCRRRRRRFLWMHPTRTSTAAHQRRNTASRGTKWEFRRSQPIDPLQVTNHCVLAEYTATDSRTGSRIA